MYEAKHWYHYEYLIRVATNDAVEITTGLEKLKVYTNILDYSVKTLQ